LAAPAAVRFYEAYQRSPIAELHFVDLGSQRAGSDIAAKLHRSWKETSRAGWDIWASITGGIILTENVSSLGTRLLERLVGHNLSDAGLYLESL